MQLNRKKFNVMNREYKPYPIGIENFEDIIKGGFLYVDKTEYIYRLTQHKGYYLLCRPRRFGKSLLMSTVQAFFEGKRELFEGLAITKYDCDWEPMPVLHLNLAGTSMASSEELKEIIADQFRIWEKLYGVEDVSPNLKVRFKNIIKTAYERTGKQVVILIDEYDCPLVAHLEDEDTKDSYREILKPIYSNLKACDRYIRMALLTGVSRFSRLSNFSDLNNLNDISMDDEFAAVCGITEQEMLNNCQYGIQKLANAEEMSYDEAVAELKANYDGYHFARQCPDIYNPFSLLKALSSKQIGDYWYATGTPTFLLKHIVSKGVDLREYLNSESDNASLSSIDSDTGDIIPMMFQTGYLTIKSYDKKNRYYQLGIPNTEVAKGLFSKLMPMYTGCDESQSKAFIRESARLLRDGKTDAFFTGLQTLLAGVSYELTGKNSEIYFENNLYVIFAMLGFNVQTEYHTSDGRIDVLIRTPRYVYVIELKLDATPETALQQINDKHYEYQFRPIDPSDARRIIKVGVNFSTSTRNITGWTIR